MLRFKTVCSWLIALLLVISFVVSMIPQSQAATYTVQSTTTTRLAPGVTTRTHTAKFSDSSTPVKYYVTTADINRSDVIVLNGYKDNNPQYGSSDPATVDLQIKASEAYHTNPANASYIENYHVVAGVNGGFFNYPSVTGIPGTRGALVMEGVSYWPYDDRPFFAILKDGTPIIGDKNTWNAYRDQIWEAVSGNVIMIKDGKDNMGNVDEDAAFVGEESNKMGTNRHPRTCVGITADGKVITMVVDAQKTGAASVRGGATIAEAAKFMLDAGCVYAMNMDGGGSSTFMTKAEGETEPTLVNVPSGGSMRAITGSLLIASTAPADHLDFEFDGTGSSRYARTLYSNRNYDQANYWATGLAGTGTGDTAVIMNSSERTMTVNLTKRSGTHSTYIAHVI